MIDPVTGWFEQAQMYGLPTSYLCQQIFVGFDNAEEFKVEFKELCANMSLKEKTSFP